MSSHSSVSAIIPVFNAANSISACIESVLNQTVRPLEIIVINDGSTDASAEIMERYENHIVYIEQKNQGQGAARNAGIRAAKGEFIAFLDSDDYWEPPFVERCTTFLEEHKEPVAVMTAWAKVIDEKTTLVVPAIMHDRRPEAPFVIDDFFKFWAEQDHVQTGAIMIRRRTIDEAGLQRSDLRISQDLEYWGLIATYGAWAFIPKVLYVNNSRINARANWAKRYETRRRLCPTVEAWQERILPRLKERELCHFAVVRGRVAAGIAHNKILSGHYYEALQTTRKYGDSMPQNRLTTLLRLGAEMGNPMWKWTCQIVRLKERIKAMKMGFAACGHTV
jgi:glycosyltransferase involved in cell wall biosynthesis